ncbi:heterokaryon incompatibility protein-domain-containing protein [Hypoxylon sp. NC1633]|nr:heterokaryon incompatibility protein-domain-containing protein [Hypoxylon sp. NC1633]
MSPSKTSKEKKRKRKDKQYLAPLKKPRLDDGTSHPKHAIQQARRSAERLRDIVRKQMKKHTNTYCYMPLKETKGEDIRVLIIEPGLEDQPIHCKLVPSALGHARATSETPAYRFTALSYFWGEGEPIHEITLTSYETPEKKLETLSHEENAAFFMWKKKQWSSSGTVYVRSNLFVALKRFRRKRKARKMWIDALCIDQDDATERSAQVKKMHELYLHAKKVCVWLGDGTGVDAPDPQDCFRFLQKMLDLKELEIIFGKDESYLGYNAYNIVRLMRNKWFSRRWVLQELALARKAEVVYGVPRMPWSNFADAIAIFIKSQDKIRPILVKTSQENAAHSWERSIADGVKNLGANALVDFTNNLFRRSEDGDIQQRMMTMEVLVSSLLAFEATDPRDTIYAVLSLAKDTYHLSTDSNGNKKYLDFDQKLSPDYKGKSLLAVYTDFIEYCIETSKSLDILLRHWASIGRQENLPSWIPLIQNSSHGTPSQRVLGRTNGDSFVGISHRTSHRNYSATLDLAPEYAFGPIPPDGSSKKTSKKTLKEQYDGHLSIKGLRIGTIKMLVARAANGMIFAEAFKIAGFDYEWWNIHEQWAEEKPRVPEGFWRTIVADRGPNGSNPPSWYSRACMDCLHNLKSGGHLLPEEVISLPKASKIAKDFLERVKDVIWERKFARVQLGKGRYTYGLMPTDTKETDIICVLFGASVPVVLRPQGECFTMVGECFVYGMMEGEAVAGKLLADKSLKPSFDKAEFFELV